MKRVLLIVAGILVAGCGTPPPPTTAPAPVKENNEPVVTPAPAASAVKKEIVPFEENQGDKIYVFASVDAMTAFNNGQPQAMKLEKPNLNSAGKMVVIEAADEAEADQLLAAYVKVHPATK